MATRSSEEVESYSAPLGVFLNLTQQCNLRCVYCCAEAVRPRPGHDDEMSDAEMLELGDQLVAAKVFRYVLTGGEVLLRRALLFRLLERLTPGAAVTVLTNGSLITEEDARRLASFRPRPQVALSIDGPDEEVNALTRGRGTLMKTLCGARRLMAQGIDPAINCVLSRSNFRALPRLIEFLKGEHFKRLAIVHLQPVGFACGVDELALSCEERRDFSREILQLAAGERELRVSAQEDEAWSGLERVLAAQPKGEARAPRTLLPCSAGVEQCCITADGWVTPCNAMQTYRCGNVRQESFLSIWQGSPRLHALRVLRRIPVSAVKECADCRFNGVCQGGCRAIGYTRSGDLLGFDATCPYRGEANPTRNREILPVIY